ncbi:MAG TPA: hypothetical protein VFF32_14305 [Dermatophilaceae bacterium]|nr:hypothetical protein [Dermatophilaceae bacterium]
MSVEVLPPPWGLALPAGGNAARRAWFRVASHGRLAEGRSAGDLLGRPGGRPHGTDRDRAASDGFAAIEDVRSYVVGELEELGLDPELQTVSAPDYFGD